MEILERNVLWSHGELDLKVYLEVKVTATRVIGRKMKLMKRNTWATETPIKCSQESD